MLLMSMSTMRKLSIAEDSFSSDLKNPCRALLRVYRKEESHAGVWAFKDLISHPECPARWAVLAAVLCFCLGPRDLGEGAG